MALGLSALSSRAERTDQVLAIRALAVLLVLAPLLLCQRDARAATSFSTIYNFNNFAGASDVVFAYADLIFDPAGNLYGTTLNGGNNVNPNCGNDGCGTVFELAPNASGGWTETVIYRFCAQSNCADGANPFQNLIIDAAGNLYGTTIAGGIQNTGCINDSGNSCGVVFKLTPNADRTAWTETILHTFCQGGSGCSDGAVPMGGLLMDATGSLYGMASEGGSNGAGVVFKLAPNSAHTAWAETVLYSFCSQTNCTDGGGPEGLIMDAAGNFYGTTAGGGIGSYGVVFQLTPNSAGAAWSETVLYSFCSLAHCVDGNNPNAGLVLDPSGAIYGTTAFGGTDDVGTVFRIKPPGISGGLWTESVLYSFTTGGGGFYPRFGLTFDASGALYGTAGGGSDQPGNGPGTVFKLTPPAAEGGAWTETVLHSFCSQANCGDGGGPGGGVIFDASGASYGTTTGGGAYNNGTVFKFSGVGVPLSRNPQSADFNADRKSDILWQNTNGAVAVWEINGLKATASGGSGNPGPAWRVIGSGYFFGSPYADILLQNAGGAVEIWQMNGWKKVGGGVVGTPAASWHAVATGDFNGDGYSDILWQNSNGAVAIWEMNGFKPIASAVIGNPGAAWHVIGAGDFNGDGKSDILFQNTNGAVAVWEMNGLKVLASATIGNPGTAWHVIGAGDFNRDGYADILFQNTNGAVAIWEMNGLKRIGGGTVGNPGTAWHVVGSGDYNGDGYSDILLQNTNGAVEIWEMDGLKRTGGGPVGNPGPAWHAIGE